MRQRDYRMSGATEIPYSSTGLVRETLQDFCEDCISREHLLSEIAELKKSPWFNDDTNGAKVIRKETIEIIDDLCINQEPSVQPKPKTGHWVEVVDEIDSFGNKTWHHECSICGNADSGWGEYKYCPNCGSYNGGGKNEA